MSDDRKEHALTAWRTLLDAPEIRMDVEDQHDDLLKMADLMEQEGGSLQPNGDNSLERQG
jgi:hypothetical protein